MKDKKSTGEIPELLSKAQLAHYFDSSTKTIERMFADGLKSIKIGGKRYVTKKSLVDYIDQNTRTA